MQWSALLQRQYGAVRASMDADVVLSLALVEAETLSEEFVSAGFRTELSRGDFQDPIPGLLKVTDSYGNRVDLLIGLRGLESQAFSRLIDVPFQGQKLKFIGREDFIAMKVFAGGPIDMMDASRAIAAAGQELNLQLLKRLAEGFGHEAAKSLQKLLATA